MRIKVADTVFEIANKYSYWEKFVTDYVTDEAVDCYIDLDESFLEEANRRNGSPISTMGYTEYLETYRKICEYILENRDGILMHGAVIEFEGCGYMFTAPSGTGKTTHIRQWHKAYGNKVRVVNGDKPILRFVDGEFIAYGTPWCGKEHYNRNTRVPLKGIVMVTRGEENVIRQVPTDEFDSFLLKQIYLPKNINGAIKTLDFAEKLFSTVPVYRLACNISTDAARVACEKIHHENSGKTE